MGKCCKGLAFIGELIQVLQEREKSKSAKEISGTSLATSVNQLCFAGNIHLSYPSFLPTQSSVKCRTCCS
jgi:hypothetical protein